MPFSSNSGKQFIASLNLKADKVLDVGAGSGTYRELLNFGTHWTALEIWEPYVHQYKLAQKYDEVILADARSFEFANKYDLCILGDVLEHMTEDEAKTVLSRARKACQTVIVSIPLGHYPQGEYEGNPYEEIGRAHV